jgi:hypothetical protein
LLRRLSRKGSKGNVDQRSDSVDSSRGFENSPDVCLRPADDPSRPLQSSAPPDLAQTQFQHPAGTLSSPGVVGVSSCLEPMFDVVDAVADVAADSIAGGSVTTSMLLY